ncbi:MAG: PIN domain-containing protein [Isosphaeraceae bacterium]
MKHAQQSGMRKPRCIVIDTNIWRCSLLLQSADGAALLKELREERIVIGMPEVVEREIIKQAVRAGKEYASETAKNFRCLTMLMGSESPYKPPSDPGIEAAAKKRMHDLEPLLVRVPFTLVHALAALDRVDSGQPPNGPKNQQFKDSAIWEAVLFLARSRDVYFITEDGGFSKNPKEPAWELADNLKTDTQGLEGKVMLYRGIQACLKALGKETKMTSISKLASILDKHLDKERLSHSAVQRNFLLTHDLIRELVDEYETDRPDTRTLLFELAYRLSLPSGDVSPIRLDPTLTVNGNCFYNSLTGEVSDIWIDSEVFRWRDESGEERTNSNYCARASGGIQFGGSSLVNTASNPEGTC